MAANGEPPVPGRHHHQEEVEERDEEANLHEYDATETSPLLPRLNSTPDQSQPQREQSAEDLLRSLSGAGAKDKNTLFRARWPSLLALVLLCVVAILIMVFAFLAPSIVEQYATSALVFEPRSLGVEGFTEQGAKVRIRGDFWLDARRVERKAVRDLGRASMWIVRSVQSGESHVQISLPEYGNVVLGTAVVPGIKVDVRDGHTTPLDFVSEVQPGEREGIRRIANDWVEGRLGQVRVLGKAEVPLKTGIFRLGTQTVRQELLFDEGDVPALPGYDIRKLNFHDASDGGMEADVELVVENEYPVDVQVPSLGFQILMEDCKATDPYIRVANAMTEKTHIHPKEDVQLDVTGFVRKLPDLLTKDCPDSDLSPLDIFIGKYIRGKENKVYVRGADAPTGDTPQWIADLTSDILVPVPLPGRTMGHLIRNFSLADTKFNLPDPFADPNLPESQPRISAKVLAMVAVPEEMTFNISTKRIRADAEVFYKGDKLGTLDLRKWQEANSTRVEGEENDEGPMLLVQSLIDKAPLNITDNEVFADVIQDLVFGDKTVVMHIEAEIDVQVKTALGEFKLRRIPAEGEVPVKPLSRGGNNPGGKLGGLQPKINDLRIVETTKSSLTLSALVNLTNPTDYAATIPYVNIHIVKNGSILGSATARDLSIVPGENSNLLVQAVYDPLNESGEKGRAIGAELLSQYISGWNTTLTLLTHAGTIPSQPALGEALSRFPLELPTPRLSVPHPPPSDGDPPGSGGDNETDTKPHFITDATMHLFTSTATFTLLSPLRHSVLYIEHLNATALYKDDIVGRIFYDLPFAVPPVDDEGRGITSPRLPVDWSLGSAGFEAVKKALGGRLKLAADAIVGVRLGEFREVVWFKGGEIGARVTL